MTAALAISETIFDFPLADIRDPGIPNYRTNLEGIDDLTASVKESGIRVPLVLRLTPDGGHELVIGARRREAARRAGLSVVPVIIRQLSDDEVLFERALENLQRVNPDPLDEAAGFQVLLKSGYSEQQLADKLGQPLRYVRERLALNGLIKDGRKALAEGEIVLGVALLVAALPASMQADALEQVKTTWKHEVMTVHGARDAITKRVLLELKNAPFKLDDAALVPAAGPCTICTKHTGSQGNLFGSTDDGDCCLDSACHKGKVDALWQIRVKQAKQDGQEVLNKKQSAEAIAHADSYRSGPFIKLDEEVYAGSNSGRRQKVRKLLGKELPPITLARDEETGAPVELVPRAALQKALKQAEPEKGQRATPDAKAKAEREAELVQAEVRRRAMVALVEACDAQCRKGTIPRSLLRLLVRGALVSTWSEIAKRVADRRGLPLTDEATGTPKKGARRQLAKLTAAERIERKLPELDEGGLASLLLELMMGRAAPGKWSEGADCYTDACAELDVNPKGIEVTVKAERKAKTKAKADGKKPAAPTPEPSRPKHPATGKPVHYIDPTGLSQSGLACGAQAADGKGVITQESEKVTCKSCRRVAGLEADGEAP